MFFIINIIEEIWFFGNLNGDQLQPTSKPLFSKCTASTPRPLSIQIPKEPKKIAGFFQTKRIDLRRHQSHHSF